MTNEHDEVGVEVRNVDETVEHAVDGTEVQDAVSSVEEPWLFNYVDKISSEQEERLQTDSFQDEMQVQETYE